MIVSGEKSLQYIINEHEGCDVRQIEEEYKCLWQNLLKLLEEERFSEYNKMQSAYLKEQSAKRYFGRSDEVCRFSFEVLRLTLFHLQ